MFKLCFWIYIKLFISIKWATSTPLSYKSSIEENLAIKQKWNECCIKNICVNNSCFFALRRSSTWAAIRQRCQSRYPDYPSLIELAQVRHEDDLELLSRMTLKENNTESRLRKVWISGISCPVSKSKGPITKWTNSKSPLPDWLQDKISNTAADKEGGCKFLAFTPAINISDIEFEFQDQTARHLGVCEFILPKEIFPPSEETTFEIISTVMTRNTRLVLHTTKAHTTTTLTSTKVESKTLGPGGQQEEMQTTTFTSSTAITNEKACKGKKKDGINWPDTAPNTTANVSCPQGMTGYAQWFCNPISLQFTPSMPHIQGCSHVWIKDLEDKVEKGKEDAVDISAKLAEETKNQNMSHGDITALVDLTAKIMHLFSMQKTGENIQEDKDKPKSYIFTDSMVSSLSNILRVEIKDAWSVLPVNHQTRAASKILQIVTTIGSHLSCIKKSEDKLQYTVAAENIDLQTFITDKENQNENDQIIFPQKTKGVTNSSLIVPANLKWTLPHLACKDYNTAVGVLYKHVGDFLKEENKSSSNKKVVTEVISFSINNHTETFKLSKGKSVTIILRHNLEGDYEHQDLRCMFWNFSKSKYGQWDDTGCLRIGSNETHVICSCNHLTNFAVLMDVNNNVQEDDILSIMTYVCCGMSSLSLVMTLACFLSIKSLHGRRSIITGNLCLALLVTNLLILFGLDKTRIKILCTVIAVFLHFSILSAFFWMLVEGYHLYKMVVLVFESGNQLSVKAYYLFAYGMPLAIVSISLGIKFDHYGGDTYCWLSDGLMWSFVGPACAVILINIVIFIMTLRSASSVRIKREQTTLKKVKNWARGSMSVMCLLGLTWCLGLFYIDRKLQVFSYIFTVFNGLQGVFIFLFHVLLNEKVHSILNWTGKSRRKKYSQQTSSNQLQSKLSTRISVNSLGCVSCNASVVHTRRSSNTTFHQKSSKDNINVRTKIKGKKNWSSENFTLNMSKKKATHTISEIGISNNHPQRRYKTRSQSFPEVGDSSQIYNNREFVTKNNNRAVVENSFW